MRKVLDYIGRETAQIAAFLSALIQLAGALFLGFTPEEQGALNAAVVFILGLLTALSVSAEKAAPLVAGAVQSVLAVALAFGLQMDAHLQSTIMAFVAAGVAWFLRTQVTAPVGPQAVMGRGLTR